MTNKTESEGEVEDSGEKDEVQVKTKGDPVVQVL
jgi:hypothetical protein